MNVFVDLLTLCNICILSNFLDPRTYNFPGLPYGHDVLPAHIMQHQTHDYNALSPDDHHYYSYVRGLAINLINWIHCHYVFNDTEGSLNDFTTLAHQYLHCHVRAIVAYKQRAEKENFQGVPNCSEEDLRHQARLLFSPYCVPEFQGFTFTECNDDDTLAWKGEYSPEKCVKPVDFQGMIQLTPLSCTN